MRVPNSTHRIPLYYPYVLKYTSRVKLLGHRLAKCKQLGVVSQLASRPSWPSKPTA
jgi:hypothetical protein